jgi:hypothetical protein
MKLNPIAYCHTCSTPYFLHSDGRRPAVDRGPVSIFGPRGIRDHAGHDVRPVHDSDCQLITGDCSYCTCGRGYPQICCTCDAGERPWQDCNIHGDVRPVEPQKEV